MSVRDREEWDFWVALYRNWKEGSFQAIATPKEQKIYWLMDDIGSGLA